MQQIQIISLSFFFKCLMPMVEFVEMKLPTIKSFKNLFKSTLPTFQLLSIIMFS